MPVIQFNYVVRGLKRIPQTEVELTPGMQDYHCDVVVASVDLFYKSEKRQLAVLIPISPGLKPDKSLIADKTKEAIARLIFDTITK